MKLSSRSFSALTLSILVAVTTAGVVCAEDDARSSARRVPVDKSRTIRDRVRSSTERRRPPVKMDEETRARIEKAKRSRGTRGETPRRRPAVEPVNRGSSSSQLEREVRSLREEVKKLRLEVKNMGQAITATRQKINQLHGRENRTQATGRDERGSRTQVR